MAERYDGGLDRTAYSSGVPVEYVYRQRFTIAEVNAGATLRAAITGRKYRLTDAMAQAIGGAAGAVTTVDILGTQSAGSVKLAAFAQASLTQNTVLRLGGSGAAAVAGTFAACDTGTALTVGITGSAITTATHIDVVIRYCLDEG